jgi:hypothetical protein
MKTSFNISDSTVVSHLFYVTAYFQKQNVSPAAAAKYFFKFVIKWCKFITNIAIVQDCKQLLRAGTVLFNIWVW